MLVQIFQAQAGLGHTIRVCQKTVPEPLEPVWSLAHWQRSAAGREARAQWRETLAGAPAAAQVQAAASPCGGITHGKISRNRKGSKNKPSKIAKNSEISKNCEMFENGEISGKSKFLGYKCYFGRQPSGNGIVWTRRFDWCQKLLDFFSGSNDIGFCARH